MSTESSEEDSEGRERPLVHWITVARFLTEAAALIDIVMPYFEQRELTTVDDTVVELFAVVAELVIELEVISRLFN